MKCVQLYPKDKNDDNVTEGNVRGKVRRSHHTNQRKLTEFYG